MDEQAPARKWARCIAGCYFGKDGKAIPEMIETFSDWYNGDYSGPALMISQWKSAIGKSHEKLKHDRGVIV
ncbi:hypothetical protein STSR3_51 [Salmonella virus STSR3]|nr:hypothetical protein STSR3_51 [Salmonella virus STSR3]